MVSGNSIVRRAKNGHLLGFHRLDRKNLGALYDFTIVAVHEVDGRSRRMLVAGYLGLADSITIAVGACLS
jgi:hypothetical protein